MAGVKPAPPTRLMRRVVGIGDMPDGERIRPGPHAPAPEGASRAAGFVAQYTANDPDRPELLSARPRQNQPPGRGVGTTFSPHPPATARFPRTAGRSQRPCGKRVCWCDQYGKRRGAVKIYFMVIGGTTVRLRKVIPPTYTTMGHESGDRGHLGQFGRRGEPVT